MFLETILEGSINVIEAIKAIVQWIIIPIGGFVWLIHRTQQVHQTEIAVIKAVQNANKEAHDREFKEMGENFKQIFTKLNNIEQALRK